MILRFSCNKIAFRISHFLNQISIINIVAIDCETMFVSQITKLNAELKAMFADKQGLQFTVFHPSWGYFAQAYGLRQIPVQIEGKNPKPAQLKELIEHATGRNIKIKYHLTWLN